MTRSTHNGKRFLIVFGLTTTLLTALLPAFNYWLDGSRVFTRDNALYVGVEPNYRFASVRGVIELESAPRVIIFGSSRVNNGFDVSALPDHYKLTYPGASVHEHVESLQVVLANGELAEFSQHDLPGSFSSKASSTTAPLTAGVDRILRKYEEPIRTCQPRSLVNRCGYQLGGIRQEKQIDLARLLVGSEGTLALITEVTLRTSSLAPHVGNELAGDLAGAIPTTMDSRKYLRRMVWRGWRQSPAQGLRYLLQLARDMRRGPAGRS